MARMALRMGRLNMDKKEINQPPQGKYDYVFILNIDPAKMLCDPVDEGNMPRFDPNCCLPSVDEINRRMKRLLSAMRK